MTAAIRSQNIEAAPGKTGISSDKIPQQLQYVLQYSGKFSTPEEYGEIVLKALPDGSVLRLKDVATIEFDSEDYNIHDRRQAFRLYHDQAASGFECP